MKKSAIILAILISSIINAQNCSCIKKTIVKDIRTDSVYKFTSFFTSIYLNSYDSLPIYFKKTIRIDSTINFSMGDQLHKSDFIEMNLTFIQKSDPKESGIVILFEDGALITESDIKVSTKSYNDKIGYTLMASIKISSEALLHGKFVKEYNGGNDLYEALQSKNIKGIGQSVHELTLVNGDILKQCFNCIAQ